MNGKPEFPLGKQILEESAGPISESHLRILSELEVLEPENPGEREFYSILCSLIFVIITLLI
jgi:hypothetical protein